MALADAFQIISFSPYTGLMMLYLCSYCVKKRHVEIHLQLNDTGLGWFEYKHRPNFLTYFAFAKLI